MDDEAWLTKREVASRLGVSLSTITRLGLPLSTITRLGLPHTRIGGQNRYLMSVVERFLGAPPRAATDKTNEPDREASPAPDEEGHATTSVRAARTVPRIALTRRESAESLGMSLTAFEEYVQPHLRLIRRGRLRLVPVAELERWTNENADWAIPPADRRRR